MKLLMEMGVAYVALIRDAGLPFLGGIAVGTAIELYMPRTWSQRWLTRGPNSLALAVLAGALLPGCAMSAVPVARSLRARGAPAGTLAAFLLVAPLISPHTIAMTAALLGMGFAVVRVILPIVCTLAFGAIINRWASHRQPVAVACAGGDGAERSCGCGGGCAGDGGGAGSRWRGRLVVAFWRNLRDMVPLFAVSLAVVALVSVFVSPVQIARFGQGSWAYLVAVVAGVPLYVCDGGEVVLTRSLLTLGVGAGPAFAFMMASVGTCLSTITMAFGIVGRRVTLAYVAGTLLLALLSGWFVGSVPALHPDVPRAGVAEEMPP